MIPHSRPEVGESDIEAVAVALRKRHLSQGAEVAALERALSQRLGGAEVIAVSSGTSALYLCLLALGIHRGDKVIIPSYTCNSLYAAVTLTGATAVCADTGENSVNIDRSTAGRLVNRSTKAIIAPHMFGFQADIPSLRKLGLPVIEDCAQAFGGVYPDGTPLGTKGDLAILSFFATKLLPAGEGGACVTKSRRTAALLRQWRDCDKQLPCSKAFNFKMTDISAALARAKLPGLKAVLRRRADIAARFDRAFGSAAFRSSSAAPQAACFRYLVSAKGRIDSMIHKARSAGIICHPPVWHPLHHTLGKACPRTEILEQQLISVPIYPSLTEREIRELCTVLPSLVSR